MRFKPGSSYYALIKAVFSVLSLFACNNEESSFVHETRWAMSKSPTSEWNRRLSKYSGDKELS